MKQILWLLLLVAGCSAQQSTIRPVAVPDETTAVQIAEKALTRIYGRRVIESERPYSNANGRHLACRRERKLRPSARN